MHFKNRTRRRKQSRTCSNSIHKPKKELENGWTRVKCQCEYSAIYADCEIRPIRGAVGVIVPLREKIYIEKVLKMTKSNRVCKSFKSRGILHSRGVLKIDANGEMC